MSKRVQHGSVKLQGKSWIGMWRDNSGHRRSRKLGNRSSMTKTEARQALLDHIAQLGINGKNQQHSTIREFIDNTFFPFYMERKWKESSAGTTEDRINYHIKQPYGGRGLETFTRHELQSLLDQKAERLSFSTVDHLRRDLKMLFWFAQEEGVIEKSPARLLVTPRNAKRPTQRVMTWEEVKTLLAIDFPLRERVVVKLALFTGVRPGELFAIKRNNVHNNHIAITQRVYRGKIDTPKTAKSTRTVAIPAGVQADLQEWLNSNPSSEWLFPSENPETPLAKDNVWGWRIQKGKYQTGIKRFLDKVGLGWVNFQVLRRTHSTLMRDLNVDPKLVADQLGHTLDVNLNVYTSTMLERRLEAVQGLETAVSGYVQ